MPIDLLGKTILGYVIDRDPALGLIGQGGFAQVYKGYSVELDMYAAIKQLTDSDPAVVKQFLEEGKKLLKLHHSHIVKAYHMMKIQGEWILLMQYASGGSLEDSMGTISDLAEIVRIIGEISSALSYIHMQMKLIHRDVKPQNILFDEFGLALLADFGLQQVSHQTASMTAQPREGTFEYTPIEQINGFSRAESDQYALAILIYEWLTGNTPYYSPTGDWVSVIASQVNPSPVPRLTNPRIQVPSDVSDVLAKALEKDYSKRFASISDFFEVFKAAMLGATNPVVVALPKAHPVKVLQKADIIATLYKSVMLSMNPINLPKLLDFLYTNGHRFTMDVFRNPANDWNHMTYPGLMWLRAIIGVTPFQYPAVMDLLIDEYLGSKRTGSSSHYRESDLRLLAEDDELLIQCVELAPDQEFLLGCDGSNFGVITKAARKSGRKVNWPALSASPFPQQIPAYLDDPEDEAKLLAHIQAYYPRQLLLLLIQQQLNVPQHILGNPYATMAESLIRYYKGHVKDVAYALGWR